MGKSDSYVFPWYTNTLRKTISFETVANAAFLGQAHENALSKHFTTSNKKFYDIALDNWRINDEVWNIEENTFDVAICTRCAYFSNDPHSLVEKMLSIVKCGGKVFIDWGLGDHWRLQPYKVGWIKNGLHESVSYQTHESKLYSCFWIDDLENHEQVIKFKNELHRQGLYDMFKVNLGDIIRHEVPNILDASEFKPIHIDALKLWDSEPQLYISTLYVKD